MRTILGFGAAALAGAVLVACGGGGGGGSTPPPPPASITINGTAARGAALPGAAVSVKCAAGTPSAVTATTAGTGAYSLTIDGATLPCALRVAGTGGEVYHSVIAGTGSSGTFTANLSPLTEMVVAQLAGTTPASFFAAFGAGSAVTDAAVTQAVTYVRSAAASVPNLGTIQPLTDALVVGNTHDLAIEAALARFTAAGLTLDAVTNAIVANPSAPSVLSAALAPVNSACPWLKSGSYRVMDPYETDPTDALFKVQIDAIANSATDESGDPLTITHAGQCEFTIDEPDFVTRLFVSSAGLIVARGESKSPPIERNFAFVIPEQTLPLSELAGTWNAASWEPEGSAPGAERKVAIAEVTIDASGQITALSGCLGLAACVPDAGPFSRLVVNPDGGFDEILPGGATWARVFLYKTLDGRRVWMTVTPEQQMIVAYPQESLGALPAVGAVSSYRDVQLFGNNTFNNPVEDTATVTAVDATTKAVTVIRTSDNRVDTRHHDTPRNGLRHRAQNACTIGGAPANCAEYVSIPLRGMGITVTTSVGGTGPSSFFNFAVGTPP